MNNRVFFSILSLWFLSVVFYVHGAVRFKREKGLEPCTELMPCGWAVYNKTTRQIENYTKNKCICTDGRRCLRDQDDISISSYVYRCRSDKS